ncbi:hypothetical protein Droror1_Dr00027705 [Drosera rotundifolia]
MHGIWVNRDQRFHRGKIKPAIVVVKLALGTIQEHVKVNKKKAMGTESRQGGSKSEGGEKHEKKWRPPEPGSFKVNLDAAVSSMGLVTTVVVVRADKRMVCAVHDKAYGG